MRIDFKPSQPVIKEDEKGFGFEGGYIKKGTHKTIEDVRKAIIPRTFEKPPPRFRPTIELIEECTQKREQIKLDQEETWNNVLRVGVLGGLGVWIAVQKYAVPFFFPEK